MAPLNLKDFEDHQRRDGNENMNNAGLGGQPGNADGAGAAAGGNGHLVNGEGRNAEAVGYDDEEMARLDRAALEYHQEVVERERLNEELIARERVEAGNPQRRQLLFNALEYARYLRVHRSEDVANIFLASFFELDPLLREMYERLAARRDQVRRGP